MIKISTETSQIEQAYEAVRRYNVYDGAGAATCAHCGASVVHSWRATDRTTGDRVSICSTCSDEPNALKKEGWNVL